MKSRQDKKSTGESTESLPRSSKFYVGTEDGEIVCTDWMPIKDGEGRFSPQRPEFSFSVHNGIVSSLDRFVSTTIILHKYVFYFEKIMCYSTYSLYGPNIYTNLEFVD